MAFYSFRGLRPRVHPRSFIHPQASVIGDVIIGKNVYVGPFASLRGDFGRIVIHEGCNIQDSCTVHMFPGVTVILEEMAHIGHGAIIHGAIIRKNALIGMHAVVMDDAEVGENSVVGALSFVPAEMKIPPGTLVAGNPARIIKEIDAEMVAWKTRGTHLYQQLAKDSLENFHPCEPEIVHQIRTNDFHTTFSLENSYETWNKRKRK